MTSTTSSVLIVDRNESTQTFLACCLSNHYDCVHARSAEQAVECLQLRRFDLVIVDITMTRSSGGALCKFIHETYPDSVLIAVSEMGGVQYQIEAMRQGAFEYLETPFDPAEVFASVEHAVLSKGPGLTGQSIAPVSIYPQVEFAPQYRLSADTLSGDAPSNKSQIRGVRTDRQNHESQATIGSDCRR